MTLYTRRPFQMNRIVFIASASHSGVRLAITNAAAAKRYPIQRIQLTAKNPPEPDGTLKVVIAVYVLKEVFGPTLRQLPLALQDHNHPVRYRNVWIRELK